MVDCDLKIEWIGGNCPVQAEGTVNGKPFYFRARGDSWSMRIGGDDVIGSPEWSYEEDYGTGPYDAGWMDEDEAEKLVNKAAEKFAAEQTPPSPVLPDKAEVTTSITKE